MPAPFTPQAAHALGIRRLTARGDSQLVCNQVGLGGWCMCGLQGQWAACTQGRGGCGWVVPWFRRDLWVPIHTCLVEE